MPERTEVYIPDVRLSDLPNGNFRSIFQFWLDAKGDRELPPYSAINPARMPAHLLPRLSLTLVEEGPKRFKLRLVGQHVRQAVGANDIGKHMEDVPGAERLVKRQAEVLASRKPYYSEGAATWAINDFHTFAALIMPFCDDTGEVRRILTYTEYK